MSQLEYTEEFEELEAADSGQTLLTSLLVCAGVFILAGIIFQLTVYGREFGLGPLAPNVIRGDVNAVSSDGHFISVSLASQEDQDRVRLGDELFIYRDGGQEYVGRAVVERHPRATLEQASNLSKLWDMPINSEEFICRVLEEYTVVDPDGNLGVRKDDKVSDVRPTSIRPVELK